MLPMRPDTPEVWLRWLEHPDPEARDLGALRFCVGFEGGPATAALPAILAALGRESEARVRSRLVQAVGRIDPLCERSVPAMRERLADPVSEVWLHAVECLWQLRPAPREVLADLSLLWRADADEKVRAAAAAVLAREAPDPGMADGLGAMLAGCSEWYVRSLAAVALAYLGEAARSFRHLLEVALGDEDESVRESAAWAVERLDAEPDAAPKRGGEVI
jgi:HEAT repeat protein